MQIKDAMQMNVLVNVRLYGPAVCKLTKYVNSTDPIPRFHSTVNDMYWLSTIK